MRTAHWLGQRFTPGPAARCCAQPVAPIRSTELIVAWQHRACRYCAALPRKHSGAATITWRHAGAPVAPPSTTRGASAEAPSAGLL